MIKILREGEIGKEILASFSSAKNSIKIISPYLSSKIVDDICEIKKKQNINIEIITRLYVEDMLKGSNDIYSIEKMYKIGIQIYAIKGLHTKLYMIDEEEFYLGSANLTLNGFFKNYEMVLLVDKEEFFADELISYFENIKNYCIKNDGVVNEKLINEIKDVYEKNKCSREKNVDSVCIKTYGASINRNPLFKSFDDLDREEDNEKLKEILTKDENDQITKEFVCKKEEKYTWSKNENSTIFLKLEGDEANSHEAMIPCDVIKDGKKIYILNFPEGGKPREIKDDDVFYFLTGGTTDAMGRRIQTVVARGHLYKYIENPYVETGWEKEREWMKKYPVYAIIKDIQVLNVARKDGIKVNEVIKEVGKDIILNSKIDSFDPYDFSSSWQGSFKISTLKASDVFDREFDLLAEKYGYKIYESDFD